MKTRWPAVVVIASIAVAGMTTATPASATPLPSTGFYDSAVNYSTSSPKIVFADDPAGTGWLTQSNANEYGGSSKYTKSPTATVTVTFTGSSLAWIGRTQSNSATVAMTLDGKSLPAVDRYSPTLIYRDMAWSTASLLTPLSSSRQHTLVLQLAPGATDPNANFFVDGFFIGNPATTASTAATGANEITVSWPTWAGATGYSITRSKAGYLDPVDFSPIQVGTSGTFVDTDIAPGVTYLYQVHTMVMDALNADDGALDSTVPVPGTVSRIEYCPEPRYEVSTQPELEAALNVAQPGESIRVTGPLAKIRVESIRPDGAPIWLCGSDDDGGNPATVGGASMAFADASAIRIDDSSNLIVTGFTVQNAYNGIEVVSSSHVSVTDNVVTNTVEGGIYSHGHVSAANNTELIDPSTDNSILWNVISGTGNTSMTATDYHGKDGRFGEGIYIGNSVGNDVCEGSDGCRADKSDRNVAAYNQIQLSRAEAIEVKEGSSDAIVYDNTVTSPDPMLQPSAITTAPVQIKGSSALVAMNTINSPWSRGIVTGISPTKADGEYGYGNKFVGNTVNMTNAKDANGAWKVAADGVSTYVWGAIGAGTDPAVAPYLSLPSCNNTVDPSSAVSRVSPATGYAPFRPSCFG
jgi:hypothetical protein